MKIKKCPFCRSNKVYISDSYHCVCCGECEAVGPSGETDAEGVKLWNAAWRKKDVEMEKNCGNCKYNLDGYCGAVPPYKSFKVHDHLCCTDWESKEPEPALLNSEDSSGKPFIDLARDELDVIQTLETKVNEYLMAAEEAAETDRQLSVVIKAKRLL